MRNKFKYKGFEVELLSDYDLGDYYIATRRDMVLYSNFVLIPDKVSMDKARHYIKHAINEFWLGCVNNGRWGAFAPEIQTSKQLEDFITQLEDEFDREHI